MKVEEVILEDKEAALEEAVASNPPAPLAPEEEKHEFESWYALRSKKIPAHHHKEILKADFKARGLTDSETLEAFDAALKKYGVILK